VRLLRSKLASKAERTLTPRNLAEALRSFEILKFDFNPYDPDCREEFKVPIVWVPNLAPAHVREENYLRLSKGEIRACFIPIFDGILSLVRKQLDGVLSDQKIKIKVR
jgi:hypothetical protein